MILFENGLVLGIGQENKERSIKKMNGWRLIDAPKMKTISCIETFLINF